MLLPSAISCEARPPLARSRFSASQVFLSGPSNKESSSPAGNGLFSTCRALQALLTGSPAPSPRSKPSRLQSPHNIRTAPNKPAKIVKPTAPKPPRGVNKRRRDLGDDGTQDQENMSSVKFSTPKRARRAPTIMPLGLAQADFNALETPQQSLSPNTNTDHAQAIIFDERFEEKSLPPDWSTEDDKVLVDLVLEKLKLSRRDWDECARRMGKENPDNVDKRWKALVGEGNVGLRRGKKAVRPRIDEAWR